jgi:hypothetical protein
MKSMIGLHMSVRRSLWFSHWLCWETLKNCSRFPQSFYNCQTLKLFRDGGPGSRCVTCRNHRECCRMSGMMEWGSHRNRWIKKSGRQGIVSARREYNNDGCCTRSMASTRYSFNSKLTVPRGRATKWFQSIDCGVDPISILVLMSEQQKCADGLEFCNQPSVCCDKLPQTKLEYIIINHSIRG